MMLTLRLATRNSRQSRMAPSRRQERFIAYSDHQIRALSVETNGRRCGKGLEIESVLEGESLDELIVLTKDRRVPIV